MKKILSAILCAAFITTIFSFTGFTKEEEKSKENPKTEAEPVTDEKAPSQKEDKNQTNDVDNKDDADDKDEIPFTSSEEVKQAINALKTMLDAGEIDEEDYVEEIYELLDRTEKNTEYKKIIKNALKNAKKDYKINCIGVVVSGKNVNFKDFDNVKPHEKNGRVSVPVRAVVQALKAEVTYNAEDETVLIKKGDISVLLTIGSQTAYVNGEKTKLENEIFTVKGRTMVPLRFISEVFHFTVNWEAETETVIIEE